MMVGIFRQGQSWAAAAMSVALLVGSAAHAESEPDPAEHWAFQAIRDSSLESLPGNSHQHPIDRFIAAGHERTGTNPVGPADRHALIRRAAFNLCGLPPSPKQVRNFVNDPEPDAFSRVLEEFLASPRYGERWGRYWLDLVRYSDTAGDDSDYPIPEAYLYRDYVIDSFNADLPYDRFLHEQLAGDLLARNAPPEKFASQVIATGYLAQSKRFATNKHEDMHLIIEDTLNTTGEVVLGLSLRCARCHDHKHDPITTKDYYALYGFFKSIVYPHPGSEEHKVPNEFIPLVPYAQFKAQVAEFETNHGKRAVELRAEIERLGEEIADKKERAEKTLPLQTELNEIASHDPRTHSPMAYAVRDGEAVDVPIQIGGNPHKKGPLVPRGVPQFFPGGGALDIPDGQSGRVELAKWLTSSQNPLTARVMVNRIWQQHFGKGLVATPSDFGLHGGKPSHPELLDWLATRFVESGWSIKAMHRLIMASETWQRASSHHPANAGIDPGNASYWRFERRRLDAEALRDAMLQLGGHLDLSRPGPHPFPPAEKWRYTAHHQFKAVYPSNHRSIYLMVQRLHPHPYLSVFNGPATTASTPKRDATTVPLQALYLSNSDFVREQAEGFSASLLEKNSESGTRLAQAYALLFSREASTAERERAEHFLARYREVLDAEGVQGAERERQSWSALARVLLASNEFFYLD